MRLVLAAAVLAIAASGCIGSLSPFCEEEGAWGAWQQREVYAALRNQTEVQGERVYHQGGGGRQTFAFTDPAYEEKTQGDGWVARVSWWSPERRYMMRPGEAPETDEAGTTWQVVTLEVDRAGAPTHDAAEADRFLTAATVMDPGMRRALVDQWINGTEETYGRVKEVRAAVAIDLAASYAALDDTGAFRPKVKVTQGPAQGTWGFAFDHVRLSWSGTPRDLKMHLDAQADGATSVYYGNVERAPESKKGFQDRVRKDFAELGLPEPAFTGLAHRGPTECAFG